MTLAPRFSSSRPKAHFVGRQHSKLDKIADPLSKLYSTRLISVAQAGSLTLRTRLLKIYVRHFVPLFHLHAVFLAENDLHRTLVFKPLYRDSVMTRIPNPPAYPSIILQAASE